MRLLVITKHSSLDLLIDIKIAKRICCFHFEVVLTCKRGQIQLDLTVFVNIVQSVDDVKNGGQI